MTTFENATRILVTLDTPDMPAGYYAVPSWTVRMIVKHTGLTAEVVVEALKALEAEHLVGEYRPGEWSLTGRGLEALCGRSATVKKVGP